MPTHTDRLEPMEPLPKSTKTCTIRLEISESLPLETIVAHCRTQSQMQDPWTQSVVRLLSQAGWRPFEFLGFCSIQG
jgi:hypothetical protein